MRATDLSANEYNEYYVAYIGLAGSNSLIDGLQEGLKTTVEFLKRVPEEKLEYRYAEGKWTIKEILRHIIDTERIFAYRALRFARNDQTALPGFDQDAYISPSNANLKTLDNLLHEFETNRLSTISLFRNFSDSMLKGIGEASNNPMSARAAGFIIIGHEIHHCSVIEERYL